MSKIKSVIRSLIPHGLIEGHRRKFRLNRMGLLDKPGILTAAEACRFEIWPAFLKKPTTPWLLVDVGANTGEFTAAVAQLVSLAGVYAFEPQPSCQKSLKQALQGIPDSNLHAVAVGAEAGEIELLCTSNSKMASVLTPSDHMTADYQKDDFAVTQRVKVPLVCLDDVIPHGTRIGLLKIDVQGYEQQVLAGAERTLRFTDALLMEVNYVPHYKDGADFDDIYKELRRQGFVMRGISAPYFGSEGPLWADAIFVREESRNSSK